MQVRNRPGKRERENGNGGGSQQENPVKSGNPKDRRDDQKKRR